jgi:hypothetical protein
MAGEVTNESLLAMLTAIQTKLSEIAEEIAGLKALAVAAPARRRDADPVEAGEQDDVAWMEERAERRAELSEG